MPTLFALVATLGVLLSTFGAGAMTLLPFRSAQSRITQAKTPAHAKTDPTALVPERTETMNFENWAVTCKVFADAPKKKTCRAQLRAQQSHSRRIILVWTMYINPKKHLVGVLETLTGVVIPAGVDLHLESGQKGKKDKGSDWKFPYQDCEPTHCHAVRTLDSKLIRDASAATAATVALRANNGETLRINFPIRGFAKAYAQLRKNAH